MNDQNVYYYDVYEMCYWLQDSWNIKKKDVNIFYAINKKESFLVLSMLSMQFKCIQIDIIMQTWCFNINKHAFKLFIAKNFAKVLQDKFTMYTFIIYNIVEESTIEYQMKVMNNSMNHITCDSWVY